MGQVVLALENRMLALPSQKLGYAGRHRDIGHVNQSLRVKAPRHAHWVRRGSQRIELRMETYNTLNHPNYGNPGTTFQTVWNNGNFGPNVNQYFGSYLTAAGTVNISNTARVGVLAAKIRF